MAPSGSLPVPAPAAATQCVQIPVLQDDPSGEGGLPLALSPQRSAFHPYFTVDLPVYVLQVWMPTLLALLSRTHLRFPMSGGCGKGQ